MSFFSTLRAKADAELAALRDDGRKLDDKIHEFFHLGALHAKLQELEATYHADVLKLKQAAEVRLRTEVMKLRDVHEAEIAKFRAEIKSS